MGPVPDALVGRPRERPSPRFRLESSDGVPAGPSPASADLPELFGLLTQLKASLCADLDAHLRSQHGVALQAFQAMSEISHQGEGCNEAGLTATLSIAPKKLDALVEDLVAAGYARSGAPTRNGARPVLTLTLRGGELLRRAGRTVDRELNRRIGSALSQGEIAQMEHALAALGSALP